MIRKACVVVRDGRGRVLAFRHPSAGCQLVKGTIEQGERPHRAALREAWEEAGLRLRHLRLIAVRRDIVPGQLWYVYQAVAGHLPNHWSHQTMDDHGHRFAFFWQARTAPAAAFARPYRRVLAALPPVAPQ